MDNDQLYLVTLRLDSALDRIERLETTVEQHNQCIGILEELNPEALESHTKPEEEMDVLVLD